MVLQQFHQLQNSEKRRQRTNAIGSFDGQVQFEAIVNRFQFTRLLCKHPESPFVWFLHAGMSFSIKIVLNTKNEIHLKKFTLPFLDCSFGSQRQLRHSQRSPAGQFASFYCLDA